MGSASQAITAAVLAFMAFGASAAPLDNPSVDDLVARLAEAPVPKGFRRTAAPDISTNVCPEAQGSAGKNLIVVPFAGDGAPSVDIEVTFASASDRLTSADAARLGVVARALNHPSLMAARFAVAGHTDAVGQRRTNLELSCARAIAVRAFLVGQGVAPERLSAYGFGPDRPVEQTQGASRQNRRVEFRRAPQ
jgi:outer membrane protein OmpA-like peptidoglycan-associated protein